MAFGSLEALPFVACPSLRWGWPWECGTNNYLRGLSGFFCAAWVCSPDYCSIPQRCGCITTGLLMSLLISPLAPVVYSRRWASLGLFVGYMASAIYWGLLAW